MCQCSTQNCKLKFFCDDPTLNQLERGHATDGGYDIRCAEHSVTIPPRESALIETKLHVAIPNGYVGIVKSRSGIASEHAVEVGAGVIDAGYRGEIHVLLYNHSDVPVTFMYGERIAQLVINRIYSAEALQVDSINDLGEADRGSSGFGSTGMQ